MVFKKIFFLANNTRNQKVISNLQEKEMSFSMTKRKLLKVTATGFEHPNIYFVNEHLTVEPIWLNN